ncbi:hypothetical protein HK102_008368 [Quaeritorhiza haematococci]|nr:hypothetical protein HK102_008368 [Quaeritorhiza haematococci]
MGDMLDEEQQMLLADSVRDYTGWMLPVLMNMVQTAAVASGRAAERHHEADILAIKRKQQDQAAGGTQVDVDSNSRAKRTRSKEQHGGSGAGERAEVIMGEPSRPATGGKTAIAGSCPNVTFAPADTEPTKTRAKYKSQYKVDGLVERLHARARASQFEVTMEEMYGVSPDMRRLEGEWCRNKRMEVPVGMVAGYDGEDSDMSEEEGSRKEARPAVVRGIRVSGVVQGDSEDSDAELPGLGSDSEDDLSPLQPRRGIRFHQVDCGDDGFVDVVEGVGDLMVERGGELRSRKPKESDHFSITLTFDQKPAPFGPCTDSKAIEEVYTTMKCLCKCVNLPFFEERRDEIHEFQKKDPVFGPILSFLKDKQIPEDKEV